MPGFVSKEVECCGLTYPSGGITEQLHKEVGKLVSPHFQGASIGNSHEALSTCFPHTPDSILTQVVEPGQLQRQTATMYTICTYYHSMNVSMQCTPSVHAYTTTQ